MTHNWKSKYKHSHVQYNDNHNQKYNETSIRKKMIRICLNKRIHTKTGKMMLTKNDTRIHISKRIKKTNIMKWKKNKTQTHTNTMTQTQTHTFKHSITHNHTQSHSHNYKHIHTQSHINTKRLTCTKKYRDTHKQTVT